MFSHAWPDDVPVSSLRVSNAPFLWDKTDAGAYQLLTLALAGDAVSEAIKVAFGHCVCYLCTCDFGLPAKKKSYLAG